MSSFEDTFLWHNKSPEAVDAFLAYEYESQQLNKIQFGILCIEMCHHPVVAVQYVEESCDFEELTVI